MTGIRDNTFDRIKGIAILLVIIGHLAHGIGWTVPIIYTFHMPLFFIVSGYFYKEKEIIQLFKRDFRTLLIPYFLISFILIIYGFLVTLWKQNPDKVWYWINAFIKAGTTDSGLGPLWFLLAMFWCRLFYNLLFKIMTHITSRPVLYSVLISYLLFIGITSAPNKMEQINYQCFINGFECMFYFSLGNLAKTYKGKISVPLNHNVSFIILINNMCSIIYSMPHSDLGTFKQHIIFNVLASSSATYLLYRLCSNNSRIDKKDFLAWYGRLSLVVFSLHTIMLRILPIDKAFEMILHTSSSYVINTLTPIFHVVITIIFCWISERSKILSYLFNIKK